MTKPKIKIDRSSFAREYSLARRIISWIISPFYIVFFFLICFLFHPLLVIAHSLGHKAFKYVFDLFNLALTYNFRLMGTKISVKFLSPLPKAPFILVANHQSMYDIPVLVRTLRGYEPMFISKVELGKGIPTISFCLRNMGGSVLIDRKDPPSAIPAIEAYGRNALANGYVATIFPEGTRAREGTMKPFKMSGLLALMRTMPGVPIVPVVVDGSWELVRYNLWPAPFGVKFSLTILPAVDPTGKTPEDVVRDVEAAIRAGLNIQRTSSTPV
jgi:1-acyl-sn-glycerol-3-phosphate acyltransferase